MSYDLDGKANQLFKQGKSKRQRLVNMNAKALYVHSLRQWNLGEKSATKGYLKRVYKELTLNERELFDILQRQQR